MDRPGTAPGRGGDAGTAGTDIVAATARFPAWLPPGSSGDSGTPEQQLRIVISSLAGPAEIPVIAGWKDEPLGRALVFRLWPARALHVVGDSPLAAEFRRLITAGAAPGWDLHPVPAGRTPLHVLAGPLHRLSGSYRFYNLLERNGFAHVEEVAATPEECLFQLPNSGPRFIAAVRQGIAQLQPGDAQPRTGSLPGSGGAGAAAGGPITPGRTARSCGQGPAGHGRLGCRGARSTDPGDLLTLTLDVEDLPPDVARSWERIRELDLRTLAGAALPDGNLPQLARDLLDELEERRRLILTSRTFAPAGAPTTASPPSSASAASASAARDLRAAAAARTAAHDRYRPLRWRAASAPRPEGTHTAAIPGTPPWMGQMLSWLAEKPA